MACSLINNIPKLENIFSKMSFNKEDLKVKSIYIILSINADLLAK